MEARMSSTGYPKPDPAASCTDTADELVTINTFLQNRHKRRQNTRLPQRGQVCRRDSKIRRWSPPLRSSLRFGRRLGLFRQPLLEWNEGVARVRDPRQRRIFQLDGDGIGVHLQRELPISFGQLLRAFATRQHVRVEKDRRWVTQSFQAFTKRFQRVSHRRS